jgi:hypothetical protein
LNFKGLKLFASKMLESLSNVIRQGFSPQGRK